MKLKKLLILFLSVFIFAGCANGPIKRATKFTTYEDFKPGPPGGVDLVWARIGLQDPDRLRAKLSGYDSVVIDQVFVVTDENALDEDEIKELSEYMVSRLTEKISPYKNVVQSPTGKSLRISVALSNIETPNPVLAVTSSVLPVGLAISTISKVTTGEHTNVGSASVELLVSDAQTGKPLFAAIDREAGNKDFSTIIDSLDDAKDAINYWVDRLGVTLKGWEQP
ncbi:DUF3313 domain-containing protein [Vibrio sinaloensis]|uniref:DUF3313 domain-containing protein n=1 Tax=Photobacterium sp. (strain ATCC 43367) TaxID=379097 RepID=UPI00057DA257|nr:DUF3313 domain-containing protein [Vibrio sinaloensis]KHT47687.1 lipoprotein [Vibrio sinaloensis]